jgi:hypothetical protein
MAEFASLRSYELFEDSVKTKARFVHDGVVEEFLDAVVATIKPRLTVWPKGKRLFRAQIGCAQVGSAGPDDQIDENDVAFSFERMVPKAKYVPEGRVNPEYIPEGRVNPLGIPCLYLADTASAAISEMHPRIGSYISLAVFETADECQLVDCARDTTRSLGLERINEDGASEPEPDAVTKEKGVWGDIGFAFSKPVSRDESHLDYVPTQILAETFRRRGYHGIIYKTLLDEEGQNIALFDTQAANWIGPCLYRVKSAAMTSVKWETVEGYGKSWPDAIHSKIEEIDLEARSPATAR